MTIAGRRMVTLMRLFTTARTQPRARREFAAREKATIEDGVGNAFGIEEGPPVRAGAFLHVGHNEDICDVAREIGKDECPRRLGKKRPCERYSIRRWLNADRSTS